LTTPEGIIMPEEWCVLHHPHDDLECQDMADIWYWNDGKHQQEGKL